MKKKIFAFILLAVAVLSLSLTSFAAGVDNIAPLRIVDEEGNPVLGLSVENAYTYVYSDADGLTDLDVGVVQGKQGTEQADFSKQISFTVTNPISGEKQNYNCLLHNDYETRIVWDKETPEESAAGLREKVEFRVIDQNGDPVKNVRFVLPPQQMLLPTNQDGKTWYFGEPFEKQWVTYYWQDSQKQERYDKALVTIRDWHLENGKMHITFRVEI